MKITQTKQDEKFKNKKNILFVDDEPSIHDGLRRMLRFQRKVWDIHFANGVNEALNIMNRKIIDAVVTDVSMPGKDGFDLLYSIRNGNGTKDTPVVILTGLSDRKLKRKALDMGATDLLNKPADPEELIARITNMVLIKSCQDEIKAHNRALEEKVRERTIDLEAARIDLIWRLGKAAEYRDSDTGNHVVRVGYYSQALAEKLGLNQKFTETIFLTSPLHDVGKIGIPDNILLKPGKLNEKEWVVMKKHCEIGAEILSRDAVRWQHLDSINNKNLVNKIIDSDNYLLRMASTIALNHHEKWNGDGYPNRLSGDKIPVAARIVAISDVYDALFSERPYKKKFPEEKAMSIMRENNRTCFDPEVFDCFERSIGTFQDIRMHFSDV